MRDDTLATLPATLTVTAAVDEDALLEDLHARISRLAPAFTQEDRRA